MTVVPLPLDPGSEARTILHHLLEHADLAGRDAAGRTLITLTFDAGAEDLEDGDDEPDDHEEMDVPPC